MSKSNKKYYNPDGIVEEEQNYKLVIRFKGEEDLNKFNNLYNTNISKHDKKVKYSDLISLKLF